MRTAGTCILTVGEGEISLSIGIRMGKSEFKGFLSEVENRIDSLFASYVLKKIQKTDL